MFKIPEIDFADRIKTDFPELQVDNLKIIATGWDHVAVEVNDSIIFRIPRGEYNIDKLSKSVIYETSILNSLQGKLPVDIPYPIYVAPGNAYFGYPKLSGVKLMDLNDKLNEDDKKHIREDWVNISSAIHKNVSVEMAIKLGVPVFVGSIGKAQQIFGIDNVSDDVKDFSKRTIKAAESVKVEELPVAVIHNDLQWFNLLVDPATKRISGVIDWTDICIAPIEKDFSIWEWGHDNQLEQVAELYEQKSGIKIDQEQAKMWRHLEEINDFIEQTESGDIKGAEQSMNHIKKWAVEINPES